MPKSLQSTTKSLNDLMGDMLRNYEKDLKHSLESSEDFDPKEVIKTIAGLNNLVEMLNTASTQLLESLENISKTSKHASYHLLKEVEKKDYFSRGVVEKNAKELRKKADELEELGESIKENLSEALTTVEDCGNLLNRYYKIE